MSGNARDRRRALRRERRFWQAVQRMKLPHPLERLRVLDGRVFLTLQDGSKWEADMERFELREHHGR